MLVYFMFYSSFIYLLKYVFDVDGGSTLKKQKNMQ